MYVIDDIGYIDNNLNNFMCWMKSEQMNETFQCG